MPAPEFPGPLLLPPPLLLGTKEGEEALLLLRVGPGSPALAPPTLSSGATVGVGDEKPPELEVSEDELALLPLPPLPPLPPPELPGTHVFPSLQQPVGVQ